MKIQVAAQCSPVKCVRQAGDTKADNVSAENVPPIDGEVQFCFVDKNNKKVVFTCKAKK